METLGAPTYFFLWLEGDLASRLPLLLVVVLILSFPIYIARRRVK
jgi:hypothetical protein